MSRAQVSVEYMAIITLLLIVVALLSSYAFFLYNGTIETNQIQNSLKDLKSTVNTVHALGDGSSLVIEITLPSSVTNTRLEGKAIFISANIFNTNFEDFVEVDANVNGSLPTLQGVHKIVIASNNGGVTLNESN